MRLRFSVCSSKVFYVLSIVHNGHTVEPGLEARLPSEKALHLTAVFCSYHQVYSLQHSKEDRMAYLNHIPGGEITLMLLVLMYGVLALAFLSGCYIRLAAQVLAIVMPLVLLFIDGNLGYWHNNCRVEFWNQLKLIGHNVGIFGAVLILATDG